MNTQNKTITYRELANRIGDMVMCNNITVVDEDLSDNLENGELEYCPEHEDMNKCTDKCDREYKEIYQYYLITEGGANYLKRCTHEIVFYSKVLNVYVWGVTHFGTSWDGVELTLINQ